MRIRPTLALCVVLVVFGSARPADADPPDSSVKDKIGTGLLRASYASTFLVQAIDASSTRQVISLGGRELNPLLESVANKPAAFYGVKMAIAASYVFSAHTIARRHKFLAIAMVTGINGVYLATAHHNLKIAEQMRTDQAARR